MLTADTVADPPRGRPIGTQPSAVDDDGALEEITDRALPPRLLTEGTRIDRYVVLGHLGSGGMGSVHAAWDPRLGRRVAIKLLRTSPVLANHHAVRLEREARALGRLNHDRVVRVFDVGEWEGAPFLTMELVEGKDILAFIAEERPDRETIVRLFLDAGEGLAAAHSVGVVHRDVKGENILVGTDRRARIGDFGIASLSEETVENLPVVAPTGNDVDFQHRVTVAGAVLGTPGYMAPEQLRGDAVDARADQFAFCVSVWKAVFDSDPFPSAPTLLARFERMRAAPQTPARRWPALEAVLARGLSFDAAGRYPDMPALLQAVAHVLQRPRRQAIAAAVVVAIGLVGGGAVFAVRHDPCGVRDAQATLHTALAATPSPLLQQALGAWVARWSTTAAGVCRRDDVEAADRFGRRACLDARRQDVAALIALVTDRKITTDAAVQAAFSLPPPEQCLDTRHVVAAAGPQLVALSEARMAFAAGALGAARDGAAAVLAAAAQRDDPRLRAEATLLLGQAQMQLGAFPDAERSLRDAVGAAMVAGAAYVEAQAWLGLVELLGDRVKRRDEAQALQPFMRAAVGRFPDDVDLQTESLIADAYLANESGAKERGAEHAGAAVERALRRSPVNPHLFGRAANLQSILLTAVGETGRAVEVLQRARDVLLTLLPPHHIRFVPLHNSLGLALRRAGDRAGARAAFAAAVAVIEAQPNPTEHAAVHGVPLGNLAMLALIDGDAATATSMAQRARDLLVGAVGENGERVTAIDDVLALAAAAEGRFDDARAHVAAWRRRYTARDPGGWQAMRAVALEETLVVEQQGPRTAGAKARARLAALRPTHEAARGSIALARAALALVDGDRVGARDALDLAASEHIDVHGSADERDLLAGLRAFVDHDDPSRLPRYLPACRLLLATLER